jgi:hypothetical protein
VDKPNSASFVWVYPIAFVLACAVLGGGIYLAASSHGWQLFAAGAACVIGVLVTWPLAIAIARSREEAASALEKSLAPVNERLQQCSVMLDLISENQLLSDRAKSVAFREKDRDALRRAIQEELGKQDFEAAASLASEIERSFGYTQEAERFRREIAEKKNELYRAKINEMVGVIDRHTRGENWTEAHREAERLKALYPNDEQVRNLPAEIDARREQHKKRLIESLREAIARKDTDGGIEIVKQLDMYLTPAEAEKIQDDVRSVFKAKLENLRTQFGIAHQEENHQEELRIAEIIIRDFPNTQMAKELRDRLVELRRRASEPATAEA